MLAGADGRGIHGALVNQLNAGSFPDAMSTRQIMDQIANLLSSSGVGPENFGSVEVLVNPGGGRDRGVGVSQSVGTNAGASRQQQDEATLDARMLEAQVGV
jgi:hypothetical protein